MLCDKLRTYLLDDPWQQVDNLLTDEMTNYESFQLPGIVISHKNLPCTTEYSQFTSVDLQVNSCGQ